MISIKIGQTWKPTLRSNKINPRTIIDFERMEDSGDIWVTYSVTYKNGKTEERGCLYDTFHDWILVHAADPS